MKRRKLTYWLLCLAVLLSTFALGSCGPTRTYWGVHSEYSLGDDGYYHPSGKHKKHKKKYKKSKKYKKHHHHHDDDD